MPINRGIRRLVDHWWLTGSGLVVAVIALTVVFYVGESNRNQQKQRATQRQAVTELSESVNDVLGRELALARVAGTPLGDVESVTLSASVGSSENTADGDTLIRDTDRALYWAKQGERNMTVIYTAEEDDQRATAGARNSAPR